jgi:hypothetical protein
MCQLSKCSTRHLRTRLLSERTQPRHSNNHKATTPEKDTGNEDLGDVPFKLWGRFQDVKLYPDTSASFLHLWFHLYPHGYLNIILRPLRALDSCSPNQSPQLISA